MNGRNKDIEIEIILPERNLRTVTKELQPARVPGRMNETPERTVLNLQRRY